MTTTTNPRMPKRGVDANGMQHRMHGQVMCIAIAAMGLAACGSSSTPATASPTPTPTATPSPTPTPTPAPSPPLVVTVSGAPTTTHLTLVGEDGNVGATVTVPGGIDGSRYYVGSAHVYYLDGATVKALARDGSISVAGQIPQPSTTVTAQDRQAYTSFAVSPDESTLVFGIPLAMAGDNGATADHSQLWTEPVGGTAASATLVYDDPNNTDNDGEVLLPFAWTSAGISVSERPKGLGGAGPFLNYTAFNAATFDLTTRTLTQPQICPITDQTGSVCVTQTELVKPVSDPEDCAELGHNDAEHAACERQLRRYQRLRRRSLPRVRFVVWGSSGPGTTSPRSSISAPWRRSPRFGMRLQPCGFPTVVSSSGRTTTGPAGPGCSHPRSRVPRRSLRTHQSAPWRRGLAGRGGFEPPEGLNIPHPLSRRALSAAQPPPQASASIGRVLRATTAAGITSTLAAWLVLGGEPLRSSPCLPHLWRWRWPP